MQVIKVADLARPLMDLMGQEIRSGPVVNVDETTVQVMKEPGKADTSKSYMWLFRGGQPDRPVLVFEYHPSRSGQIPLDYLSGYQGYVQCDAYSGYDALGRQEGVVLLGCWSHARRKFDEVIKARGGAKRKGSAEQALEYIGRLYAAEKKAREAGLDSDAIRDLRQREAKPVLDEFKAWMDAKILATPPKGLLGKAILYTLNNWQPVSVKVDVAFFGKTFSKLAAMFHIICAVASSLGNVKGQDERCAPLTLPRLPARGLISR